MHVDVSMIFAEEVLYITFTYFSLDYVSGIRAHYAISDYQAHDVEAFGLAPPFNLA